MNYDNNNYNPESYIYKVGADYNALKKDVNVNTGIKDKFSRLYGLNTSTVGLTANSIPQSSVTNNITNIVSSTTTSSNIPTIDNAFTLGQAGLSWSGVYSYSYYDGSGNPLYIFRSVVTPAGTSPVADSLSDSLTFTSSDSSHTITGNSATDTIDFTFNLTTFNELSQDAVGGILTDTATINFTYTDSGPNITADVIDDSITYAKIQNISTTDRLLGRDTAGSGNTEELTVGGGIEFTGSGGIRLSALSVVTETTTYTITSNDYTVLCDATLAGFTITLPAAASNTGKIFFIKKIDATGNVVTVDGNASETIDGQLTQSLDAQWESIIVQSDGTNFYILSVN